jgi:hypothetical protein
MTRLLVRCAVYSRINRRAFQWRHSRDDGPVSTPKTYCLDGVVVSVLASGTKGRGFESGQGDGFLRAIKIHITPSFGWEVKPEVPCRKILRHVKDISKSQCDGETKFSFPSPILLLVPEMSLLTGPPDSTGGCQSALVDELGFIPSQYHHTMGPHYKSPGDERKARRGRSSETSVSPRHNQSTNIPIQHW